MKRLAQLYTARKQQWQELDTFTLFLSTKLYVWFCESQVCSQIACVIAGHFGDVDILHPGG